MFELFGPFEGVAAESPLNKFYSFFFYVDNHLLTLNSWIFNATKTPPVIMTFLVLLNFVNNVVIFELKELTLDWIFCNPAIIVKQET